MKPKYANGPPQPSLSFKSAVKCCKYRGTAAKYCQLRQGLRRVGMGMLTENTRQKSHFTAMSPRRDTRSYLRCLSFAKPMSSIAGFSSAGDDHVWRSLPVACRLRRGQSIRLVKKQTDVTDPTFFQLKSHPDSQATKDMKRD